MNAHTRLQVGLPQRDDVTAGREYALNSVAELARRAKQAGYLRPDFVLDDLILVLMANDGICATSPAARVAASRRFAALAIQAFRASQPGGDLGIICSVSLVRSLHAAGLIDRYTLVICPLTLGCGARLFEGPAPLTEFELTSSVTTTKGVIIAQYTRR